MFVDLEESISDQQFTQNYLSKYIKSIKCYRYNVKYLQFDLLKQRAYF